MGSLRLISHERGCLPVSVQDLSDDERIYLEQIDGSPWLGDARLLISSAAFTSHRPQRRRIVVVCDTAFDNIPERLIGKPPPTHAVGYADGSTGLISVDEFQKLDLSGFVDLATIAARGDERDEQAELPTSNNERP